MLVLLLNLIGMKNETGAAEASSKAQSPKRHLRAPPPLMMVSEMPITFLVYF